MAIYCECEKWNNNIKKINEADKLVVALKWHNGIDRFSYCPYCGKELKYDRDGGWVDS